MLRRVGIKRGSRATLKRQQILRRRSTRFGKGGAGRAVHTTPPAPTDSPDRSYLPPRLLLNGARRGAQNGQDLYHLHASRPCHDRRGYLGGDLVPEHSGTLRNVSLLIT